MSFANGSNYSNKTIDTTRPKHSNASQFSGTQGSDITYTVPFPPINVEQNHYDINENQPEGNNLKINSIGNLPDENQVPVFEVDLGNVDKYGAQQKFG